MRTRTSLILAVVVALLATTGLARADAGYGDPAYLQHDLDNMARSTVQGRQLAELTDPSYGLALTPAAAETYLRDLGRQVGDAPQGRVYLTLGQLVPGGDVGDPTKLHEITPARADFVSRTGAKLAARVWTDGRTGPHAGVVITPGSLQGPQPFYWWAARTLAEAGYQVLTFDAQGQGGSETFGHAAGSPIPTGDGFPFQQEPNFVDGTVDALRFLLSTQADPYVPGGWTPDQVDAARAADPSLTWVNPGHGTLDPSRVALAGHSLGARAVSVVQQCSDLADLWQSLPVCGGRSFPIRAVVAWDQLSSDGVTPVVPAIDEEADGYFLNPQPSTQPPAADAHLDAFNAWRAAGIDTYSFTVRGGTHLEWVDVPYILPSTQYGVHMAAAYTLAWIDRYLSSSPATQQAASDALLSAPVPDRATGGADELPWRADFMSARYLSALAVHDLDGSAHAAVDLRAYAGLSPVGDWTGANADRPAMRATP